jgi:hypothetical protein
MNKFFKGVSIVFGTVVVLGIGGCMATMGSDEETTTTQEVKPVVKEVKKETPVIKEAPKKEEPKFSISQQNAIKQAENYIESMPFSEKGLINQLVFEGYSQEDAAFAVKNIQVDWRYQAVRHAKQYLESMPFSKSGLIEQLIFEGYSKEDATYAASQVGL